MFIKYKSGNDYFHVNDLKTSVFCFDIGNEKNIQFKIINNSLRVFIDSFLLKNIFYYKLDNFWVLTTDIDKIENKVKNQYADYCFEKYGFLPLDITYWENVGLLNSFLIYEFSEQVNLYENFFNIKRKNIIYSIDDIYKTLEKYTLLYVNQKRVLPLSGGMDSRLLLNVHLNSNCPVYCYSHGEKKCGDLLISKKIEKVCNINVVFGYLEDFKKEDLQNNYFLSDYFLPIKRILYWPSSHYFNFPHVIVSGLYGDVIWGKHKKINFQNEFRHHFKEIKLSPVGKKIYDIYKSQIDSNIFYNVLVRAQKLTRMSLVMTKDSKVVAPWVSNEMLQIVNTNMSSIDYSKIVRKFMNKKLKNIFHQSSQSTFTYPKYLRILQKIYFRATFNDISKPYFSNKTLKRLQS